MSVRRSKYVLYSCRPTIDASATCSEHRNTKVTRLADVRGRAYTVSCWTAGKRDFKAGLIDVFVKWVPGAEYVMHHCLVFRLIVQFNGAFSTMHSHSHNQCFLIVLWF